MGSLPEKYIHFFFFFDSRYVHHKEHTGQTTERWVFPQKIGSGTRHKGSYRNIPPYISVLFISQTTDVSVK